MNKKEMDLSLMDMERVLLKEALMDTIKNSEKFVTIEKDVLEGICKRISDFENENGIEYPYKSK